MAQRIRFYFGYGGANFPGSRELYEAAAKIEAWAAEQEESSVKWGPDHPSYDEMGQ